MPSGIALFGLMVWGLVASSGCSIYMRANEPVYKDINVAQPGTPRQTVIHEFGMPEMNYPDKDGKQVDVFKLAPGAETAQTKTAVTTFFWIADSLTLGLWEVIATPYEMITKPEMRTYVITYKAYSTVEKVDSYGEGESIGRT